MQCYGYWIAPNYGNCLIQTWPLGTAEECGNAKGSHDRTLFMGHDSRVIVRYLAGNTHVASHRRSSRHFGRDCRSGTTQSRMNQRKQFPFPGRIQWSWCRRRRYVIIQWGIRMMNTPISSDTSDDATTRCVSGVEGNCCCDACAEYTSEILTERKWFGICGDDLLPFVASAYWNT